MHWVLFKSENVVFMLNYVLFCHFGIFVSGYCNWVYIALSILNSLKFKHWCRRNVHALIIWFLSHSAIVFTRPHHHCFQFITPISDVVSRSRTSIMVYLRNKPHGTKLKEHSIEHKRISRPRFRQFPLAVSAACSFNSHVIQQLFGLTTDIWRCVRVLHRV